MRTIEDFKKKLTKEQLEIFNQNNYSIKYEKQEIETLKLFNEDGISLDEFIEKLNIFICELKEKYVDVEIEYIDHDGINFLCRHIETDEEYMKRIDRDEERIFDILNDNINYTEKLKMENIKLKEENKILKERLTKI